LFVPAEGRSPGGSCDSKKRENRTTKEVRNNAALSTGETDRREKVKSSNSTAFERGDAGEGLESFDPEQGVGHHEGNS